MFNVEGERGGKRVHDAQAGRGAGRYIKNRQREARLQRCKTVWPIARPLGTRPADTRAGKPDQSASLSAPRRRSPAPAGRKIQVHRRSPARAPLRFDDAWGCRVSKLRTPCSPPGGVGGGRREAWKSGLFSHMPRSHVARALNGLPDNSYAAR